MPFLQPAITRVASGAAGYTDLYVPDTNTDASGTTIIGSLVVSGPALQLGPDAIAQMTVLDTSGVKMTITESAGAGEIVQEGPGGAVLAPSLEFAGDLSVKTTAGATQAKFLAAGGLSMNSALSMNNNTIQLGSGSQIYYDSGQQETVIICPKTKQILFADASGAILSTVSPTGTYSVAFGTFGNQTATPLSVPTATPTTVITLPLSGGSKWTASFRVLIGVSDGATNYNTYHADIDVFWQGTTSAHYIVGNTSNLPPGWSITVPTMTSGDVVFEHTFGSALDVYVSYVRFGQNI